MRKLKQLTVVLMVALTVCTGSYADMLQTNPAPEIIVVQPRYSYTDQIRAELSFSNGQAICKGFVVPTGTYDVTVTVTLYRKEGGMWKFIKSWHGNATHGHTAAASGSVAVERGTYKLITSGNVGGLEYPKEVVEKTY